MDWLAHIPTALLIGVIGAAVFELVTVALRFGLGWTSPSRTRALARWTRGWRIHHGYPGIALLLISPLLGFAPLGGVLSPGSADVLLGLCLAVGMTLALSDLVHHALVLPALVGRHEFDLRYPGDNQQPPRP